MRIKDNLAFFENLSRENSKSELGSEKVKSSLTGPRRGSRGPLKSNPLPPLKKALSTELTISDKNEDLKRYSVNTIHLIVYDDPVIHNIFDPSSVL